MVWCTASHTNSASSSAGHLLLISLAWPCNVLDFETVLVVLVDDVMAKVTGVLAFYAAHVATAEDQLLAPDGACATFCYDMVLGAEEQMGDERSADAVVPGFGFGGKCSAPGCINETLSSTKVDYPQLDEIWLFAVEYRSQAAPLR